jgi:hypothetical protein
MIVLIKRLPKAISNEIINAVFRVASLEKKVTKKAAETIS